MEAQRVLDDRYRLLAELGGGGMGTVWRAMDLQSGRVVALKILPTDAALGPDASYRFRREFRAASRIRHPHVVEAYELSLGSVTYYTMEYVEGRPISIDLGLGARQPPLEVLNAPDRMRRLISALQQVLSALDAIHAQGLVHRDLKPDNILVREQPRDTPDVKVVDFGLARDLEDSRRITRTGVVVGTLSYIAPEQVAGGGVDGRADLYAVGVLLYKLLTGTLPFRSDERSRVLIKHLREAPEPPRRRNPGVPAFLESITLRLLKKDPFERFQSAAELLRVLEKGARDSMPNIGAGASLALAGGEGRGVIFRPCLVGRDAELGRLTAACERARAGRGSLIRISGAAGAGKLRLVEALALALRPLAMPVLVGRALGAELPPFASVSELLERLARAAGPPHGSTGGLGPLDALLPDPGAAGRSEHDRSLTLGFARDVRALVADRVRALASKTPAVLALETGVDPVAHEVALELEACARAEPCVILLLESPADPAEGQPASVDASELNLELAPLTLAHTILLVSSMLGDPDVAELAGEAIFGASRGLPLHSEEAVRGLVARGALVHRAGRWTLDQELMAEVTASWAEPGSVVSMSVAGRLAQLSDAGRGLAALIAACGGAVPFERLLALEGLVEEELVDGVDELLRRQLLSEDSAGGSVFRVPHRLIVAAIDSALGPQAMRTAYGRLAALPERAGLEGLRRARHVAAAGLSLEIPEHVARCASQLEALGAVEAAAEVASSLTGPASPVDLPLRRARSVAWQIVGRRRRASGDRREALQAFAAALAAARGAGNPAGEAAALVERAEVLAADEQLGGACEAAAAVLALIGASGRAQARAHLVLARAAGAGSAAHRHGQSAHDAALAAGASDLLGECHELLAHGHELKGRLVDAVSAFEASAEAYGRAADLASEARVLIRLAELLSELGEPAGAVAEATRAAELARRAGDAELARKAQAAVEAAGAGRPQRPPAPGTPD